MLALASRACSVRTASSFLGKRCQHEVAFKTTPTLDIATPARGPGEAGSIPVYQLLDFEGHLRPEVADPCSSIDEAQTIYKQMLLSSEFDRFCYDVQRQGRISFFMTQFGEEASVIGAGHGLDASDVIYAQYREGGLLMVRGWTLDDYMNQLYSNHLDLGKGKQMPMHYGTRKLNLHTISSPLTTQVPQAAGAGYALKRRPDNRSIVACFFGEGAASEGDFHAGMNFAATLTCPVLFFCRNNGYAISTPTEDQYRGDGIASRAAGYGMKSVRVDGNDVWAVRHAVSECRKEILKTNEPILLETMSYRVGHHSTSDDSTRYRQTDEISFWTEHNNPISRLRTYLYDKKWWSPEQDAELVKTLRKDIREALKRAEVRKKPRISELFNDVYEERLPHLIEQETAMLKHIKDHASSYSLERFEPELQ